MRKSKLKTKVEQKHDDVQKKQDEDEESADEIPIKEVSDNEVSDDYSSENDSYSDDYKTKSDDETNKKTKEKSDSELDSSSEHSEIIDDEEPDIDINNEDTIPNKTEKIRIYKPVLHNQIVFIAPENRITSEYATKYECTEAISIRAKQIENGGTCFTDITNLTKPLDMARKELFDKKSPLDVIRMITDIIAERWHMNELVIPQDF